MSGQCPYNVIPVPISLSSQCPDTGIQKKEWCHPSPLGVIPVWNPGFPQPH
ncbi:hypothetical protein [Wolbachia pipientis]|uniref:Uncharacterized protein n=1 Tax=Wolbachia pipientis TaxID=955 RepID=A0A7G5CDC1_WOLPI|nr:hypothetical protein [Wolbachia pipientis]QMV47205.1 hypothetical protein HC356_04190 [Wolbachia pipientis]